MKPFNKSSAGIADFKARLSSYLRRVKSGEEVEILERGIPVAVIHPIRNHTPLEIVPSRKDPALLAKYPFSISPKKAFDVVELILKDRQTR
ncbi:MAG: type II toxin-antitoxin system prevent-host-death family antitoxin [Deltaproteobacteria bacterium]|nr:type II toxin-antitoxin system prevent-host-death family antitoxin [Deltaproteobacteria bacterium]